MTSRTYNVRFAEWQAFTKDIIADSPDHAVILARLIHDARGIAEFEKYDNGSENWPSSSTVRTLLLPNSWLRFGTSICPAAPAT